MAIIEVNNLVKKYKIIEKEEGLKGYLKHLIKPKYKELKAVNGITFNIEEGDMAQISITNNIGYYEFSINNYKNEEISDVSFWYIIEVVSDIEDNIEFELYQEDNQIALENLKTEKIYIKGGEKTQQKYKLKMIYKGKDKDQLLFEKVHIKIKSEQERI